MKAGDFTDRRVRKIASELQKTAQSDWLDTAAQGIETAAKKGYGELQDQVYPYFDENVSDPAFVPETAEQSYSPGLTPEEQRQRMSNYYPSKAEKFNEMMEGNEALQHVTGRPQNLVGNDQGLQSQNQNQKENMKKWLRQFSRDF